MFVMENLSVLGISLLQPRFAACADGTQNLDAAGVRHSGGMEW